MKIKIKNKNISWFDKSLKNDLEIKRAKKKKKLKILYHPL